MGPAFHQLCPRYSGTLTPTAPTAIRLWETVTFTFFNVGGVTVLVFCSLSDHVLYLYQIKWKYLKGFQSY